MSHQLKQTIGQYSDKGRKPVNQDFYAAMVPREPALRLKGLAVALADGVSSSNVSHIASETAVKSFLEDYYATPDPWSVRQSAYQVLMATNAWLHAQTRNSQFRYEQEKGYVCTFSAVVIKSTVAHLFHCGDSRISLVRAGQLEVLTDEHRVWVEPEKSYLSRALGFNPRLEIDYATVALEKGDTFVLTTDGVHEHVDEPFIIDAIGRHANDLDAAARAIAEQAFAQDSQDNLTCQLLRLDELPLQSSAEVLQGVDKLPFAEVPAPGRTLDGYQTIREVQVSSRSHLHLMLDTESGEQVVMKTPSNDLRDDSAYLERLLLEEWIARRIDSPYVLKAGSSRRPRTRLYVISEFLEGQTLTAWMAANPNPDLAIVRDLTNQIARGLRAFHRLEMLHRDIRPENIMIDDASKLKIIDFGSVRVAGIAESQEPAGNGLEMGTVQYTAPELFLGYEASEGSDLFSLGVVVYQMISGELPYGADAARVRNGRDQARLRYRPLYSQACDVPLWVDQALRKAVDPNPTRRYQFISEFLVDLSKPNQALINSRKLAVLERSPAGFWRGVSAILFVLVLVLAWQLQHQAL